MKSIILLTINLLLFTTVFGQPSSESFMRSNQKIFVAVAVLLLILIGLLSFLFSLEKRLKKLENK